MANSGTLNGAITTTNTATSQAVLGIGAVGLLGSPLPIPNGGTGSNLGSVANIVLYGSAGGGTLTSTAVDINGRTIISKTDLTNAAATFTQGTGFTVTNGANTIAFSIPAATTSTRGSYTLCTGAEAVTGTDTTKAVTPSTLTSRLQAPGTIGGTTLAAAKFTSIVLGTVGGVQFLAHSGSPNGVVTAPKGSWCTNIGTPAGLTDRVFINTDGGTTWTGITSVA